MHFSVAINIMLAYFQPCINGDVKLTEHAYECDLLEMLMCLDTLTLS